MTRKETPTNWTERACMGVGGCAGGWVEGAERGRGVKKQKTNVEVLGQPDSGR